MDVDASLVPIFFLPTGAFATLPTDSSSADRNYASNEHHLQKDEANPIEATQPLMATARTTTTDYDGELNQSPEPLWRIDGCCNQGTRYLIRSNIPGRRFPPRRVDIFVPYPYQVEAELRSWLQLCDAFALTDSRVAQLQISKILACSLTHQSLSRPGFVTEYLGLPYGSRIIVERLAAKPQDVKMHLVPDFAPEKGLLSCQTLRAMWNLDEWPEEIDLSALVLDYQIHDTVSMVKMAATADASQKHIFKTATEGIKHLYHELKMLLTMPTHQHTMTRPTHIVTLPDRFGGSPKLYQIRWATQIAVTLKHVTSTSASFYSELKTDNVLMASPEELHAFLPASALHDDSLGPTNIVLIDWEQMGNWLEMTAPEIHYVEFAVFLAKPTTEGVPEEVREKCRRLVDQHIPGYFQVSETYTDPAKAYYQPWTALSGWEQESAMIYSLGMIMWCIFEGVPSPKNPLSKIFKTEDEQEFPQFTTRTPQLVRNLIKACTQGHKDWSTQGKVSKTTTNDSANTHAYDIVRRGYRFYPRGQSGVNGEPVADEHTTRWTAREMWRARLRDMEEYLEVKGRYREGGGLDRKQDERLLGLPLRPRLDEVLAVLRSL